MSRFATALARCGVPACVMAVALAGCASQRPVEWRLLGRAADTQVDAVGTLPSRIEALGGMPLSASPTQPAPGWLAFSLQCPDTASCKRATMRLAAQPGLFTELRREDVKRLPSRPPASTTP